MHTKNRTAASHKEYRCQGKDNAPHSSRGAHTKTEKGEARAHNGRTKRGEAKTEKGLSSILWIKKEKKITFNFQTLLLKTRAVLLAVVPSPTYLGCNIRSARQALNLHQPRTRCNTRSEASRQPRTLWSLPGPRVTLPFKLWMFSFSFHLSFVLQFLQGHL